MAELERAALSLQRGCSWGPVVPEQWWLSLSPEPASTLLANRICWWKSEDAARVGRVLWEYVSWRGGNVLLLQQGESVEFDVWGWCSNEEYKYTRNWISLVLLVLGVISLHVLWRNLIVFLIKSNSSSSLSLDNLEIYSWQGSIFMGSPACLQSRARNASGYQRL